VRTQCCVCVCVCCVICVRAASCVCAVLCGRVGVCGACVRVRTCCVLRMRVLRACCVMLRAVCVVLRAQPAVSRLSGGGRCPSPVPPPPKNMIGPHRGCLYSTRVTQRRAGSQGKADGQGDGEAGRQGREGPSAARARARSQSPPWKVAQVLYNKGVLMAGCSAVPVAPSVSGCCAQLTKKKINQTSMNAPLGDWD
jgi:hypothetical protein